MRKQDRSNYGFDYDIDRDKQREIKRKERRRKKRRREAIIRLASSLALILVIIFAVSKLFNSNKKTVAKIETAIKTNDRDYIDKNMDRLGLIMDALRTSYSEDENEGKEFLNNCFKNLKLTYIEEKKVTGGKEITLEIENINYVDVYNSLGEDKSHKTYMNLLADEKSPKKKARVTIFVRNKVFKKKIYESRPFVNAILGGALDYAN